MPSIASGVDKLKYAYQNKQQLKEKAQSLVPNILEKYSWDNVGKQILQLVK
jgi:hypothetical protein